MPILTWLAAIVTHPAFEKILVPALAEMLSRFFSNRAMGAAVKSAKAAKSAEEFRIASAKLGDAVRRK